MSHVFPRRTSGTTPIAVRAKGVWITDAEGNRYLDAAGGAVVVNLGHGDRDIARVMSTQAERLAYAHATAFTTDVLEMYADDLAPLLPVDEPRIYPVSGGSEAVETALKLARAYHLARGDDRTVVIGRTASYHGSTITGLDVGGKETLRRPAAPWRGRVAPVQAGS